MNKIVYATRDSRFLKKGEEYICELINDGFYCIKHRGWHPEDNFKSLEDIREDKINKLLSE